MKKVIGEWAMDVASQASRDILHGKERLLVISYPSFNFRQPVSWRYKLANGLVLKRIVQQIGLDCVKLAMSIGAPINVSTIEFFAGINIPIMEAYGMSEGAVAQC